ETFHPAVGVLLNITADHLDRYPDLKSYGQSKAKLFARQTEDDVAVLNAEDELIMELTRNIRARSCLFNISSRTECGARIERGDICLFTPGGGRVKIECGDSFPPGRHNLENAAAAALAAFSAGADFESIGAGLREFVSDPHRMQRVACINGVDYYDDSKGTNVDAVIRAVEAVQPPVILILGGRDKGGGYKDLTEVIQRRVKAMVLMGEAADSIDRELGGIVETRRAVSMKEAVARAAELASAGGTVLFSPACASFDMYENYARRGEDFQRAVHSVGKNRDGKQQGNI
ncbi:MAG: UDP-N-acetylmuramoyl-L-alanine--D-glutamate ligase, partial [Desulfosalsimonas sp.]